MLTNKKTNLLLILLLIAFSTVACTKSKDKNTLHEGNEIEQEEIELTWWQPGYSEERFRNEIADHVEEKFQHITMKLENSGDIEDLIIDNVPIDLYKVGIRSAHNLIMDYQLQYDLSELIEKHDYDLNLINNEVLDGIREIGNGKLYAFPSLVNNIRLYYNPDIFDRFGEDYPTEEMTWEEITRLANRLTRKEDGKQFLGLTIDYGFYFYANQLSVPLVDPETNEVQFMKPEWKTLIDNLVSIYQLTGYEDAVANGPGYQYSDIWRGEQTVAMAIYPYLITNEWLDLELSYDIGVMPTFEGHFGIWSQPIPDFNGVASISKHKDEAFKVLAYLHSPEFQEIWAKSGIGVAIDDPEIREVFGQEAPAFEGKNSQNFYPPEYAPMHEITRYDGVAMNALNEKLEQLFNGEIDTNTALREATEAANHAIKDIIEKSEDE